jgi:hypothetical protein
LGFRESWTALPGYEQSPKPVPSHARLIAGPSGGSDSDHGQTVAHPSHYLGRRHRAGRACNLSAYVEKDHRRDPLNAEPRGNRLLSVGIELDQPHLRLQFMSSCLNMVRTKVPRYRREPISCCGRSGGRRSASTSSGCPANTLALHFPHLTPMGGRDGGKRLIVPHCCRSRDFQSLASALGVHAAAFGCLRLRLARPRYM